MPQPPRTDPTTRRTLGIALAVGAAAVVLFEVWQLADAALTGPGGFERGAVWVILLMILVTFLTVGGIGYGLYRAIRGAGGREDEPGGSRGGPGGGPHAEGP